MISAELTAHPLTARLAAIRLLPAAVHADVHVAHAARLAIMARVRVYHLHRLGVTAVQPIRSARLDQRPRRIQSDDPLDAEFQVVGQNAAQVGAQRVADARCARHGHAGAPQEREVLRQTAGDRLQIVHGGHVARCRAQGAPVDHEHVVVTVTDVRCSNDRTQRSAQHIIYFAYCSRFRARARAHNIELTVFQYDRRQGIVAAGVTVDQYNVLLVGAPAAVAQPVRLADVDLRNGNRNTDN